MSLITVTAGLAIYAAGSTVENKSRTDEYKTYAKYVQSFGIAVGIVGIIQYFLPASFYQPAPVRVSDGRVTVRIDDNGIRMPGLTMDGNGVRMPGLTMDASGITMPGLKIGS
jgi:hypothetical protein